MTSRIQPRWVVVARFATVGLTNTAIDVALFMLLHDSLGILGANLVSTSAGMAFSFIVNGLVTFGSSRLTMRHAALFLATTGVTMWVVQPVLIGLLDGSLPVLAAKLLALTVSVVLNFAAYRWVVWPPSYDDAVSSARQP
ncbi:GtrA family protein [Nocardioides psychrotolerans]|uniref:GtrA family protein n=1 Tax=Nocardioides psychrotolerans TaxID=1005945 RepID=UPI0031383B32